MKPEEHLRACQFCAGLDPTELEALSAIVRIETVPRGSMLFWEGDRATGFYALLSGRLRVYKASAAGKEYTIHRIQPGQIFAEVAIFQGGSYPANCSALEDSTVAFFPKDRFVALIKNSPQISLKIISSLSGFLREYNEKIESLSLKDVPARIASFLLSEAERTGSNTVILKSSKAEWAASLGTIGETLSRSLRKLKELQVIQEKSKKITILDPQRLSAIASGEKIQF